MEAVRDDLRRISGLVLGVTFRACDGKMRPRQTKAALLMLRNRVGGRLEAGNAVAILAAIFVRSLRELAPVRIGVAIETICERDFISRGCSGRDVALRARHRHVPPFQRIVGRGVFLDAELRGLPAVHGVAFRALAFLLPGCELPTVRVRRVTVRAFRECDRLFEISPGMAFQAIHFDVLAEQGIFCFGVVELLAGRNSLPAIGCVACLAGLRE